LAAEAVDGDGKTPALRAVLFLQQQVELEEEGVVLEVLSEQLHCPELQIQEAEEEMA
jgi:hypothetical protein